jgi:hypothetical protein
MTDRPPCPRCGKTPDSVRKSPIDDATFLTIEFTAKKDQLYIFTCSCGLSFIATARAVDRERAEA